MATLGRLVASLAHELNTPLGAILSASDSESRDAARFLDDLRSLRGFSDREFSAFGTIARCALNREPGPDHGAERARRKQYLAVLEARGIEEATLVAEELVDSGFSGCVDEVEAMAGEADFPTVVHAAYRLSSVIRSNLIVRSAAQKAARVVGALKTYSHHGSAEVLRRGDIREQLETALILHHNRLKAGIEVVRLFREIPLVACYPDRLGQVWMNLIDNAVQSMGNSGHLIIETALETALDGDHVLVSVIDDGPGIAAEHHGEIFKPFFTTKSPGEGTGLGLDICRRLLEQIGATLSFESRPGRTEFVVRLKAVS
jgi:signal transduction histidine kinase